MDGQARFAALNACQALIQQGRFSEAEQRAREALAEDHQFTEARAVLAFVLSRQGRWQEMAAELEQVLAVEPERAQAWAQLARAYQQIGRVADAERTLHRASKAGPPDAKLIYELARIQASQGHFAPAAQSLQQAIALEPRVAPLRLALGQAYAALDRIADARDAFRAAVSIDPADVGSVVGLVQQLIRLNLFEEAYDAIQEGLRHRPDAVMLLVLLGGALSRRGDMAGAESAYQRAAELDPSAVQSYAAWLQEQGRFDESAEWLEQSIQTNPSQGLAYYRLTEVRRFEIAGSPLTVRAEQALASKALGKPERMYLHFALGKAYEHDRRFEEAMSSFDRANAEAFDIYNIGRPYEKDKERETNDRRIARFTEEALRKAEAGSQSARPILIVGMIRSGTTLLDQIVSSHRDVASAGETRFWIAEADRQFRGEARDPKDVATDYLKLLQETDSEAGRITDKMPLNYAYLGLIQATFPNAKILHIRRNAVDTCLSIYSTHLGLGPRFAYNKANIVSNYLEYLRLMDHWRQSLPKGAMFEIDYETLVADAEQTTREVLEFCQLDWDPECLAHQSSRSAIHTPSRWQARQPMYKTSIAKWKPYEPYLGEFGELRRLERGVKGSEQ